MGAMQALIYNLPAYFPLLFTVFLEYWAVWIFFSCRTILLPCFMLHMCRSLCAGHSHKLIEYNLDASIIDLALALAFIFLVIRWFLGLQSSF